MVIFGVDAHKRTHTVVAVDGVGRQLGSTTTTATTTNEHLALRRWAQDFGPDRVWAVEDCRHLSRRFEADLLRAGEEIVRVPPKLMAHTRASARTCGKSDPIDALAVAQAALRHPDLPRAGLDDPSRTLRLLVDYRDDLLTDRTAWTNRLRWHLHELDPTWDPPARALSRLAQLDTILARLGTYPSDHIVARVATNEAPPHPRPHHRDQPTRTRDHRTRPAPGPHPAGHPRRRRAHRRQDPRRSRQHPPLPHQGSLRPPQRHRPHPRLVRQHHPPPALTHRQPSTQLRPPPHRHHPNPPPPRRQGLPRTTTHPRQHRPRSPPRPQTTPLRRHLPSPPSRRRPQPTPPSRRLT